MYSQVTTAAVEQYTGEGEPPYCEMTLRAPLPKENPGDLNFVAGLKLGKNKIPVSISRRFEEPHFPPSAQISSLPAWLFTA